MFFGEEAFVLRLKAQTSEWQIYHLADRLFRQASLGNDLQVSHATSNRNLQLMRVNHRGEPFSASQAPCRLSQQVGIARKQNATEFSGPVQQRSIFPFGPSIILGRQHVHTEAPQAARDRGRHTLVHVKREAHRARVAARSRRCIGASPVATRRSRTRFKSRSICASISFWWS